MGFILSLRNDVTVSDRGPGELQLQVPGRPATILSFKQVTPAIRDVFMERIVTAKGIDRASARIDRVLMPTPAAVLEAARLLAVGVEGREGLGPLVIVDPGGATTDVHSIGSGEPATPGVIRHGLPEPHAKRTVEGDLGMRHNEGAIVDAVGLNAIAVDAGRRRTRTPSACRSMAQPPQRSRNRLRAEQPRAVCEASRSCCCGCGFSRRLRDPSRPARTRPPRRTASRGLRGFL